MKKAFAVLTAFLATVVASYVLLPTAVWAVDPTTPMAQADHHLLTITPAVWTIITGLVMPFVVAFVTKVNASPKLKGVVGILLAAVAAVIERATLADGHALISTGLLVDVGMIYGPQLTTYLGVWQHFGLNASIAPSTGVGGTPSPTKP